MRKIALLCLLSTTAAMAQVSGPLVTTPVNSALTETLAVISNMGMSDALAVREFRVERSHEITKVTAEQQALMSAASIAPSLSVPANAPYTQTAIYQPLGSSLGTNFEALGVGTPGFSISGAPPDTTLGVSATQIVQWVNSQFAVYNKAGTPLLAAPGFLNGNQIWQALPLASMCRATNRGDPLVQYDKLANRWILSQFAFTGGGGTPPYSQCIAVSQTDNALGAYNLYEYSFGSDLPDYGKLGVWPDAYYITYNMFNLGANFSGGRACAYDRAAMLAGAANPVSVCFNSTDRFSFLPADLDGTTLPPAGAPNPHISWNWAFTATAPYAMQVTKFKPNFVTPAMSTFDDGLGGAPFSFVAFNMDASTFASCNDNGNNCVSQPGTAQKLDTLGSRQMYRNVYRNFGSHDALLFTQAVDMTGGNPSKATMRWWEIRNPNSGAPVVFQNSNFMPDATNERWMSSAAFDKHGNIAIGYSIAGPSTFPSIRISARKKNDPKNLLRSEATVVAGTGSQTTGLARWGDYSTMQIDPVDDCTFWFTTQYIGANGTFNWRTRIASFRFPSCV